MAKCVLCGQDLGVLSRRHILFHGVEQPICADCKKHYDQSERKDWLCQRMLQSPDLRDRAYIEQSVQMDQEREEEEQQKKQRKRQSKENVQCCGRSMTYMKTTYLRRSGRACWPNGVICPRCPYFDVRSAVR